MRQECLRGSFIRQVSQTFEHERGDIIMRRKTGFSDDRIEIMTFLQLGLLGLWPLLGSGLYGVVHAGTDPVGF